MNERKEYIFTLGEDSPRIYQGKLLSPMKGFSVGLKVAKLVARSLGELDIEGKENSLKKLLDGNVKDEDALPDIIALLVSAFSNFDVESYINLVYEVTSDTWIGAKVDGESQTSVLNNSQNLNRWFEKYPQDLLLFSAHILARNSSPFLPAEFLKTTLSRTNTLSTSPSRKTRA